MKAYELTPDFELKAVDTPSDEAAERRTALAYAAGAEVMAGNPNASMPEWVNFDAVAVGGEMAVQTAMRAQHVVEAREER
jgi:hypothetical protein